MLNILSFVFYAYVFLTIFFFITGLGFSLISLMMKAKIKIKTTLLELAKDSIMWPYVLYMIICEMVKWK